MVALLPAFQALAVFCSLAFAAPASHVHKRDTLPHTHHVRSLPNGLVMRTYHPRSTFETFAGGIDHPLSKRGVSASLREGAMSFLTEKLGDAAVWRSAVNRNTTTSHVYAYQQVNGIPVINSVASVSLNKANKVVAFSQNFVPTDKVASKDPKVTVDAAVASATKLLSGKATGRNTTLAYYALEDGSLALTQGVEMKLANQHTVRAFVDAETGKVQGLHDFTANLAYRVSPFSSQDPSADFELVTDPEDLTASPQGWTTFDGEDTGQTVGNNVVSFFDDPNAGVTTESATGEFDFNLDLTQDPTVANNLDASRTNAFVTTNTVHDIAFRYGFDEDAFNFQQTNLAGGGGVDGDVVLASVQDASGTDNAQFTTLEDGQQGVMQMFLFTGTDPEKDGALVNDVVIHEMTHGISNRLVGGGTANCLQTEESVGLGEGWSDAFADWAFQVSGQIVDYAVGNFLVPGGIRRFPYSLDRTVNPLVFSDVAALDEVHDIGEVMAQTLHVVHAALIQVNGFAADANTNPEGTGGNTVWMHLFIDSLQLMPCNPTFLDARAAWIQADVDRFSAANACTLWTAFASMGLGPDAASGVDDFDVPVSCGGNGSEVASTGDGGAAGNAGTDANGGANGGGRRGRGRRGRNNGFAAERKGRGNNKHKH